MLLLAALISHAAQRTGGSEMETEPPLQFVLEKTLEV